MYTDIMVDIETLSTRPNAVVLSIGAVKFNLQDQDKKDDIPQERTFYATLHINEQTALDRHIDANTIVWWIGKSKEARHAAFESPAPVTQVLADFAEFCDGAEGLWGNGATFDNVIIRDLYRNFEVPFPLKYNVDRDLRTLKDLAGAEGHSHEASHHALDDALWQVVDAQTYFDRITRQGASR